MQRARLASCCGSRQLRGWLHVGAPVQRPGIVLGLGKPLGCRVLCTDRPPLREDMKEQKGGAQKGPQTQITPPPATQQAGPLAAVDPYIRLMRMDKPIGTTLLLWPCVWSISLAAPLGELPDLQTLSLFTVGAVVMRGAGCTINDYWDRDIDGKVARTRTRPIAAGEISPNQALAFFVAQLTVGLGVLVQLPPFAIGLGACSVPLVVAYPLAKRYTNWPQFVLGLTFNWGALLGWAAVHSSVHLPAVLPLYAGSVCWTIVYDTLYAHQDKKDDASLGLRSTALTMGDHTKPILTAFALATSAGITSAGYAADLSTPFYVASALGAGQLMWQIHGADLEDPDDLAMRFKASNWYGAIISAGSNTSKMKH